MKYRVDVTSIETTMGWYYVEADDAEDAFQIVYNLDDDVIRSYAEWGSCGDQKEIIVTESVEEVWEPTVSDGLWV